MQELSDTEKEAIDWLKDQGGSVLFYNILPKNSRGIFGEFIPGMTIFRQLEKKGLVVFVEDEILDDGIELTGSVDLI